jgi:hypothetical protein
VELDCNIAREIYAPSYSKSPFLPCSGRAK